MAVPVEEQAEARRARARDASSSRYVTPRDIEWIDDAVAEWPASVRWDVKGWTPSRPELVAKLWEGVVDQRVVVGGDGQPAGLVQLVGVDARQGTARLDIIARDAAEVAGTTLAFVGDAVRSARLRAVYTYAGVDALDVPVVLPPARQVGRFSDHLLRGRGRYEDVAIYQLGAEAVAGP